MKHLKIFLSSTAEDLEETRHSILKFLGVLQSDIISMEIFGSDESKPKDFSLAQVERCNLFIGVYAERYGTIDDETGLSMTELEYREALKMLEGGNLVGLLTYVIDPQANWPLNLVDREPESSKKLGQFKEHLTSRHTVTFFRSTTDLPFLVLRDVIRKIGLTTTYFFQPKSESRPQETRFIERPIGMEYYTEEFSSFFYGREKESETLLTQVMEHKMSLLIGASGVGKTSLINAGLFPGLQKLGWRTARVRPLTEPLKNLRRSLWDQLLQGVPPKEFDFLAVTHAVASACQPAHVLIVIDQFEDILGPEASADTEALTGALLDLYRSSEMNVRFLICYRGDVEAQIGSIWQKVSGSPAGLPRLYLGPLMKKDCELVLSGNLSALGISLEDKRDASAKMFLRLIVDDLATESLLSGYSGVYPPFMQMIISRVFVDADARRKYSHQLYTSGGGCQGIISDYLIRQLRYLGRSEQKGREILIALVSSYGTKAQKTSEEISKETLLSRAEVERLLYSLIDLRLVRAINNLFEIVHDFLAKRILAEVVSTGEREAKKFKELLASRAAAFPLTKAILTKAEHLHIYKYRNKILCSEEEIQLLLASHLAGNGPINFWLRSCPREKVLKWVHSFLTSEDWISRLNAYRFLIKAGEKIPLHEVSEHFSGWQLQSELAEFILKLARPDDIPLLMQLHRKKSQETSEASEKALLGFVSLSNVEVLDRLARSSSRRNRQLFESLCLNLAGGLSRSTIEDMWDARAHWKKLFSLYALGRRGTKKHLIWLKSLLHTRKFKFAYQEATIKSIVRLACRRRNPGIVRALLNSREPSITKLCLEALELPKSGLTVEEVFRHYSTFPFEVSRLILKFSRRRELPVLIREFKQIAPDPAARDIVLAICRHGAEKEFDFLLDHFLNTTDHIAFWNSTLVVREVAKLAGRKDVTTLQSFFKSSEFWEYHRADERPGDQIPVMNYDNIYFVKRLIGVAYAKVAGRKNRKTLYKLLSHKYWVIWNAAADSIVKLSRALDLPELIENAIASGDHQNGSLKVLNSLDERL